MAKSSNNSHSQESPKSGGLFKKVHCLEMLENLEIPENTHPQTVENKGESGHFLEILEIPQVKSPFRNDPFFRSLHCTKQLLGGRDSLFTIGSHHEHKDQP